MRLTQIFAIAAIALVSTFAVADDAAEKTIRKSLEALQLDTPRADFTFLYLVLQVLQVTGQHVLLLDLKHRRRKQGAVVRLIFDPHFILLAQLRLERLAPSIRGRGTD